MSTCCNSIPMIHFNICDFKFFEISKEIFLPPWSLFKNWLYTYSYLDNKAIFDNHQKSRPFFVCHHHNKIFFQNQNIHKIVDWIYFVPVPMFLLTWLLMKEDFQQFKIEKYNQSDVANLQQPENQTFKEWWWANIAASYPKLHSHISEFSQSLNFYT